MLLESANLQQKELEEVVENRDRWTKTVSSKFDNSHPSFKLQPLTNWNQK